MVSPVFQPTDLADPSTAELPPVTSIQKIVAAILMISMLLPPGAAYSAPSSQPPLGHFAPTSDRTSPTYSLFTWPPVSHWIPSPQITQHPKKTASFHESFASAWKQTKPRHGVTATSRASGASVAWEPIDTSPLGAIAPPDGVPLQTPYPTTPTPQAQPGMPLEVGNCVIVGEVSDSSSLNPIPGAIIDAVGTGRTVESDASGKFRIEGLPPGTYTLEAGKLGYFSETAVITAIEAQPAEARFGLRIKPTDDTAEETTLEEETIVGEYQGDSQGDFNLDLVAEAPALTAGIDRELFAKTGVSDAADAVAKISGANIVDGKYAVVRGLADRYITTTFNGAQIASADPSRKAVQLDLFPSTVIEAINVDKTYSPQLAGDFGGGAIDILSRTFPEKRILNFKVKMETNSGLDEKMYVNPERSLGFFGDPGKEMPDVLETTSPATGSPEFLPTPTTDPNDLKEKSKELHLSRDLLPKEDKAEDAYSYRLTYGETFDLPNGMKLGVMSAFGQSSGDDNNTSDINNQNRNYILDTYERGVEHYAFLSAGLKINDLNTVQATYFNLHSVKDVVDQGRRITGGSQNYGSIINYSNTTLVRDTYGADAVYYREFWDIGVVERNMEIIQAKGDHRLSEDGIEINWAATESNSAENRPHSSHFEYGLLDFSAKALAPYVAEANARLDQQVKDNAAFFGLDPATATWANSRATIASIIGEESASAIEINAGLPVVNDSLPALNTIYPVAGLVGQNERTITAFRRIDKTEESASHQQMGVKIPFHFGEKSDNRLFEIGVGGSKLQKTRNVSARVYGLVTAETNGSFSFPDTLGGLGTDLANDPSGIADHFTGNVNTGPYYGYGVGDGGVENIDTILDQDAIYISGALTLGDSFISGGVRQETESYQIDVASAPLIPFTDAQVAALEWEKRDDQEALLPSITTGTSVFEKSLDLLFAWSVTIARPTFWEFLPTTSTDQSSGIVRRGNVALDHTTIHNFDLAATLRPTDNITLRTSFFHKDLERPLVQVFTNGGIIYRDAAFDASGNILPYDATINGVEIEAEVTKLGPFSFRGNFTYIDAALNYYFEGGGKISPVQSQLPFQPSMIANATLGYEFEPWDLSAYLTYNLTGEYPTILKSSEADFEVTRQENSSLDLVLAKKITVQDADCTVRFGIKNLLDVDDTYIYAGQTYSNEAVGRSYYLEAEVSF